MKRYLLPGITGVLTLLTLLVLDRLGVFPDSIVRAGVVGGVSCLVATWVASLISAAERRGS